MQIILKRNILDKIRDEINQLELNNKRNDIDYILLTQDEALDLYNLTEPHINPFKICFYLSKQEKINKINTSHLYDIKCKVIK